MNWKTRLILSIVMTSIMVMMVTLLATWLALGLDPHFLQQWIKAYFIARAGRGAHRFPVHARRPAHHRPHHDDIWLGMMLSRSTLRAGSTPARSRRRMSSRCARWLFPRRKPTSAPCAHLDLRGAPTRKNPEASKSALRGLPIAIKTFSTPPTCLRPTARPSTPATVRGADASLVVMASSTGGNLIGKTVTTPFAFLDPAAYEESAPIPRTRRAALPPVRRPPSPPLAWCQSRSARQTGGIDHSSCRLLRHRRLQAVVPDAADRRHQVLLVVARHARIFRCKRRRRRFRRRSDLGPCLRVDGREPKPATSRAGAHAHLGRREPRTMRTPLRPPRMPRR